MSKVAQRLTELVTENADAFHGEAIRYLLAYCLLLEERIKKLESEVKAINTKP